MDSPHLGVSDRVSRLEARQEQAPTLKDLSDAEVRSRDRLEAAIDRLRSTLLSSIDDHMLTANRTSVAQFELAREQTRQFIASAMEEFRAEMKRDQRETTVTIAKTAAGIASAVAGGVGAAVVIVMRALESGATP